MAHNLLPEAPKVFYLYSRLISIYLYVINNILGTYNFIAWIEETFAMNRMIFLYNINRLVILTVIFALPGCTFMKLMTSRIEKPTFTYTGFEVVEASQSATRVNFLFSVHNPNEAGLKNVTCSYELFVEGKQILKGRHRDQNPCNDRLYGFIPRCEVCRKTDFIRSENNPRDDRSHLFWETCDLYRGRQRKTDFLRDEICTDCRYSSAAGRKDIGTDGTSNRILRTDAFL
jgi:hypothetical protein